MKLTTGSIFSVRKVGVASTPRVMTIFYHSKQALLPIYRTTECRQLEETSEPRFYPHCLHSYTPHTTHLNLYSSKCYEYECILCDLQDSANLSAWKTCAFFFLLRKIHEEGKSHLGWNPPSGGCMQGLGI